MVIVWHRRRSIARLAGVFSWLTATCIAQTAGAPTTAVSPYVLHIPVDEIALTFHASDFTGRPLTQLTIHDLVLSDNGKRQDHIMLLQPLQNLPIRAGFVFDISASMSKDMDFNRSVIQLYASSLLRRGADQAFVMQFDTEPLLVQDWTDRDSEIAAETTEIGRRPNRIDPLTAIFDSLYITCRDHWNQQGPESTGNFILLFSDGEDDASHAHLSEAVDMCQRRHIAIYVFASKRSSPFSDGYKTLKDLAEQTGGRVFDHPRGGKIWDDLKIMEEEQRYQYRLVYKPSNFTADGSFHRIRLQSVIPRAQITTRSGYYAFARP